MHVSATASDHPEHAVLADVAVAIHDETQHIARAGVIRPGGRRYVEAPRSLGQRC